MNWPNAIDASESYVISGVVSDVISEFSTFCIAYPVFLGWYFARVPSPKPVALFCFFFKAFLQNCALKT